MLTKRSFLAVAAGAAAGGLGLQARADTGRLAVVFVGHEL